ncbi:MAG: serpin family protein [Kiritimatiellaeota bacterium]|nr:serpin family protein [Kiritimatiellota bacterium]
MNKSWMGCSVVMLNLIAGLGASAQEQSVPGQPAVAAQAINALGLELLAKGTVPRDNALLSPYSIQAALAMTYAGAAGATRAEMAKVLHYTGEEAGLHAAFAALQQALAEIARRTAEQAEQAKRFGGGGGDPVTLTVANRLFGQTGYEFRAPFLALVKDTYGAPFQPMDFIKEATKVTREINGWVEKQTRQRIRDLIPADGLNDETRLVLVNAIYLKAPWAEVFPEQATQPAPFHLSGDTARDVPTMVRHGQFGYARREGYSAITIPYSGGDLQFLVLLPDAVDGLAAVEAKLTPEQLAACAHTRATDVILHLPKFKMEPPLFRLGKVLQTLGMASAFDRPRGSANFDRMAPRKPDDYLYISEVFHKTFLALDEKGTEAAAATAVAMMQATAIMMDPPKPIEVRVDHPFLFAIQHRPSGACLFWGRLTNPVNVAQK